MMLIDVTKCTACRGCQTACKNWNQFPAEKTRFTGSYENPSDFTPFTWTRVAFNEVESGRAVTWNFAKLQCLHCADPICVAVCPQQALYKTAFHVAMHYDRCNGCGFCQVFCPFEVPRVNDALKKMFKCFMCWDRVLADRLPACVEACPTGAVQFGFEKHLLPAAEKRVWELRRSGKPRAQLYGAATGVALGRVVYVLDDGPAAYKLEGKPVVLWLQGASCTGCSVSLLNSVEPGSPSIEKVVLDVIALNYHHNIMAASGQMAMEHLFDTAEKYKGQFFLVVEGGVPLKDNGYFCTIGDKSGKHITLLHALKEVGGAGPQP